MANSLNNLGNLAHTLGDFREAQDLHQASLTIQRQLENQRGIANSLYNLGNVADDLGDYTQAWDLHEECLKIRRRLGNQGQIADSLYSMARLTSRQNQPLRAVQICGAASALWESAGIPMTSAYQEDMNTMLASVRKISGEEFLHCRLERGAGDDAGAVGGVRAVQRRLRGKRRQNGYSSFSSLLP